LPGQTSNYFIKNKTPEHKTIIYISMESKHLLLDVCGGEKNNAKIIMFVFLRMKKF